VDPSNVEPRKVDPKTAALTGVCEGGVDERARPDTPPKIGGRFSKRHERRGFYGSPMMPDLLRECVQRVVRVI
jgi:hypothetical protein